jgi:hypothetical protein
VRAAAHPPVLLSAQVEGHHIRVDRAAPPAAAADGAAAGAGGSAGVQYDPARSVFVGNLDFKVCVCERERERERERENLQFNTLHALLLHTFKVTVGSCEVQQRVCKEP